jgi:uncharacterized membrane protein
MFAVITLEDACCPCLSLFCGFLLFRGAGALGVATLSNSIISLRFALALMLLFTASAHWGRGRPDLIRMVPPLFPRPDLLVTVTGILEILGAVGLLIPSTARTAATCLTVLLIAMFPANAHAARQKLTIMGRPVPSLPVRALLQVIFVAALLTAGWGNVMD